MTPNPLECVGKATVNWQAWLWWEVQFSPFCLENSARGRLAGSNYNRTERSICGSAIASLRLYVFTDLSEESLFSSFLYPGDCFCQRCRKLRHASLQYSCTARGIKERTTTSRYTFESTPVASPMMAKQPTAAVSGILVLTVCVLTNRGPINEVGRYRDAQPVEENIRNALDV